MRLGIEESSEGQREAGPDHEDRDIGRVHDHDDASNEDKNEGDRLWPAGQLIALADNLVVRWGSVERPFYLITMLITRA